MSGGATIVCEGLVKIYRIAGRQVVALQGLELEVAAGEMLAVVGPSGAGKSTLLNVIGGLDAPSAGRVLVDGVNLNDFSDSCLDRYRRERVGFVWQLPGRNLIPYLTAWENVALPMVLAQHPERIRRERVTELLAAVGLSERAGHIPARLSGGEQQRLALAVALANRPSLLLADEPTGELDSATARDIYRLIRSLNQTYGMTVVIVSHDPGIAHVVDRVITIRDGKISTESRVTDYALEITEQASSIAEPQVTVEELTVLDSAGRLQLPKELREDYGIGDRVRLERVPDGILVRPVQQTRGKNE
ncbi:MAG: ATP-binding cassette domain-containing protein [Anaerolineae bacterium]|nr:ATP-binding cassette domain-containing protein [Anaerolineae bacterium]